MKKRIFSGAQPTGNLHIGNYLGALKNWVNLQNEYDAFYCIVNLHAVTLPQNPELLRQKTLNLARIYLAAGVDPEISKIFIQSDVHEHAELAWILSCVSRMGELERMTQFKDKGKGNTERAGVGLFTYPVLMASTPRKRRFNHSTPRRSETPTNSRSHTPYLDSPARRARWQSPASRRRCRCRPPEPRP